MCFSATASFTAGGVLVATGIASMVVAKPPARLLFASIPVLFGLQQLAEGGLWMTGDTCYSNAFLFFAWIVWPIWIPLSILFFNPPYRRNKLLLTCLVVGCLVSFTLLGELLFSGAQASITDHHILYNLGGPSAGVFFYFIPTIGSFFTVKNRLFHLFGMLILTAAILSAWLWFTWFTSVWCFFAAILSVLVFYAVYTSGQQKAT